MYKIFKLLPIMTFDSDSEQSLVYLSTLTNKNILQKINDD